jgi:type IX secretion system PorP/SprF family membrane protein
VMNKHRIKFLFSLLLGFCSATAVAQDHIYSQFFNAPLYLNPALTGQFEGDVRLNMIYRNQFSGLSQGLNYLTASADINIPSFGGGVGVLFNRSSEGTAYLVKNNLAATYSYSVGSDDFIASFGIQAGVTNRTISWNKLVFSDQIDPRLGYLPGSISAADMPDISNKYFFDAAAGINIVAKSFMIGASFYHINKPNESFSGAEAKLPLRTTINSSYRIPLSHNAAYYDDGAYVIPSVIYYQQEKLRSISLGAQLKYRNLNTGIWYRTAGQGSPDAIVVSLIFDILGRGKSGDKWRLGLSHDATTSKINYTNTSGTTEASVGYQTYLRNSENYQKFNGLRCYDFY